MLTLCKSIHNLQPSSAGIFMLRCLLAPEKNYAPSGDDKINIRMGKITIRVSIDSFETPIVTSCAVPPPDTFHQSS
jgi:hypothetical protein